MFSYTFQGSLIFPIFLIFGPLLSITFQDRPQNFMGGGGNRRDRCLAIKASERRRSSARLARQTFRIHNQTLDDRCHLDPLKPAARFSHKKQPILLVILCQYMCYDVTYAPALAYVSARFVSAWRWGSERRELPELHRLAARESILNSNLKSALLAARPSRVMITRNEISSLSGEVFSAQGIPGRKGRLGLSSSGRGRAAWSETSSSNTEFMETLRHNIHPERPLEAQERSRVPGG